MPIPHLPNEILCGYGPTKGGRRTTGHKNTKYKREVLKTSRTTRSCIGCELSTAILIAVTCLAASSPAPRHYIELAAVKGVKIPVEI